MQKNIVLLGINDKEKRAVLSLELTQNSISGKVRLYGFSREPSGILSLGITCGGKVIKAGLIKKESNLYEFSSPSVCQSENFSCAVVNFVGGQPTPILYGSCEKNRDLEKTLEDVCGQVKGAQNMEQVEEILDNVGLDYDGEIKEEIEEIIDKEFEQNSIKIQEKSQKNQDFCPNCENCAYKKYFFDMQEKEEFPAETLNAQEESQSFYSEIKKQIDLLFEQHQAESYLENAIPQSKWVKVEFEEGGDYYVFGLVYEEDELKYICYGVPGIYSSTPPKQLSGYPIWFPLDKNNEQGFGYWLTYQDAETGESIKAIIE